MILSCSSNAQIYKCTDQNGKLLLSDKPCTSGELLQRKRSADEIRQDDLRAQQANRQKYERRAKEAQSGSNRHSRQGPAYTQSLQPNRRDTEDCRLAQRDLDFTHNSIARNANEKRDQVNAAIAKANSACGSSTELIQPPPPKQPSPSQTSTPTHFVNCDPSGCVDNNGQFYSRSGPNVLIGPNGATCTNGGGSWNCN